MNISFGAGRVFLAGSTKNLSKQSEVKQLRQYAKENDCDVVVLNRSYYINNTGTYDTFLVHTSEVTGQNSITEKHFDFKKRPFDKEA